MLANSRIASVNGRTRMLENSSTGARSGRIHQGAPSGTAILLK